MDCFIERQDDYYLRYTIKPTKRNKLFFSINTNNVINLYYPKTSNYSEAKNYIRENFYYFIDMLNNQPINIDILNFANNNKVYKKISKQVNIEDFKTPIGNAFILDYQCINQMNALNKKNKHSLVNNQLIFYTHSRVYFYKSIYAHIQQLIKLKKIEWDRQQASEIVKLAFKHNIKFSLFLDNKLVYKFNKNHLQLNFQIIFLPKIIRSFLIDSILKQVLENECKISCYQEWNSIYNLNKGCEWVSMVKDELLKRYYKFEI